MSIFTIYNPETKELGPELEFKDYIQANNYCKANYPEGWVAKHEPFHFNSDMRAMLKDGTHPDIKTDNRGNVCAVIVDGVVNHCGYITMGELEFMRRAQIPTNYISKYDFIKLHNSLII